MKHLILFFVFTITLMFNVKGQDSTLIEPIQNEVSYTDTSNTFKMIYSDIKEAISGLAEGLNVGAKHVYTVLVKQQLVNSFTNLLILGISLFLIFSFLKSYKSEEIWETHDNPTGLGIYRILQGLIGLTLFIFFVANISETITGLINPEYGAMENIIELIKD